MTEQPYRKIMHKMDSDDSLEEGEIPSPKAAPSGVHQIAPDYYELVSDDATPKSPEKPRKQRRRRKARSPRIEKAVASKVTVARWKLPRNCPTLRQTIQKRKMKKPNVPDFDLMRSKILYRLQQKRRFENGGCQEIAETEIAEVEMEDVPSLPVLVDLQEPIPITIHESEDDMELEQLRVRALESQRTQTKVSDENTTTSPESVENEFSLRAEALKTAILKKRPAILQKKHKKKERLKESIENRKNVEANWSSVSESDASNKSVVVESKEGEEGKENIEEEGNEGKEQSESIGAIGEQEEEGGDELLRQQLLATLPVRNPPSLLNSSNSIDQETSSQHTNKNVEETVLVHNVQNRVRCSTIKVSQKEENKMSSIVKRKTPPATLPKVNALVASCSSKLKEEVARKVMITKKRPTLMAVPAEERIVVRLGSDSSDDNDDDCHEKSKPIVAGGLVNSIDDFLLDARRRLEASAVPLTPEAVHAHLPPSQRLEYIQLKRKLAEKEKHLKLKTEQPASPSQLDTKPVLSQNQPKLLSHLVNPPTTIVTAIKQPNRTNVTKLTTANLAKPSSLNNIPPKSVQLTTSKITTSKKSISFLQNKNQSLTPNPKLDSVKLKERIEISRIRQYMAILKKELAHDKSSRDELARLKLQMACVEQKRVAHATRAGLLRAKIKRMLGQARKPLESKKDNLFELEEGKSSKAGRETQEKISNQSDSREKNTNVVNGQRQTLKNSDITGIVVGVIGESPKVSHMKIETDERVGSKTDSKIKYTNLSLSAPGGSFVTYESPLNRNDSAPLGLDPLKELCPHDLAGACRDPDCPYQHARL